MTTIAGFILRCLNRKITADFYAKLGLTISEHQHGGHLHFEVEPIAHEDVFAVELYTASAHFPRDAIMLIVDSIDVALAAVKEFGIEPKSEIKTSENKKFCYRYITDPDGRDVMLIQKLPEAE